MGDADIQRGVMEYWSKGILGIAFPSLHCSSIRATAHAQISASIVSPDHPFLHNPKLELRFFLSIHNSHSGTQPQRHRKLHLIPGHNADCQYYSPCLHNYSCCQPCSKAECLSIYCLTHEYTHLLYCYRLTWGQMRQHYCLQILSRIQLRTSDQEPVPDMFWCFRVQNR